MTENAAPRTERTELVEGLRRLRERFDEFRGRL
jgi:hypothetical protein